MWAEGGGDDPEVRLRGALSAAGVRDVGGGVSALIAVFLGDCDEDAPLDLWAREFRETAGLVVCTGGGSRVAPRVCVTPLPDDDIELIVRSAAPEIDGERVAQVVALSDRLPSTASASVGGLRVRGSPLGSPTTQIMGSKICSTRAMHSI